MKADHLTYSRAVSVSLIGLALQLVMGLALLAYGAVFRDHPGFSAALLVLVLAPVWLLLAIVFDQHRRERIEALEHESFVESGGREASAFSETASDLRVQAARLSWMHRILLPVGTLLIAGTLAGVCVWRYLSGAPYLDPDKFRSSAFVGWPISLGLALAFTGFVFARYVAGMAKQPVWNNLRAGAAAAVAVAVAGLALSVGHLVDYLGPNMVIRAMHVAIPLLMGVLATEFVLNFLLAMYRPRRPGEFARVSFDSRLLGFLAAPDRIAESIGGALNYQFGFDVSGSWFYQLLSKSIFRLVALGLVVIWLLTCVAVVKPHEQGLRIRLGAQVGTAALESGPYLKLPWPLERIETFPASAARRVSLGVEPPKLANRSILWTNDHNVDETYFLVQPAASDRSATGSQSNTSTDLFMISAEVPLVFSVADFAKYENFASPESRERIISAIGKRELTQLIGQYNMDEALGAGRERVAKDLRSRVQTQLDAMNSGVQVLFVGVAGAHPPRDTAASFEAVVQSTQKRESSVRLAEQEANQTLIKVAGDVAMARTIVDAIARLEDHKRTPAPSGKGEEHTRRTKELELEVESLVAKAGGSAASLIQEAKAERWNRHMLARARADAQEGRLAGYRACPEAYVAKSYFNTLRLMMSKSRLYIVADDPRIEVRTNLEEPANTGNIFLNTKPKE